MSKHPPRLSHPPTGPHAVEDLGHAQNPAWWTVMTLGIIAGAVGTWAVFVLSPLLGIIAVVLTVLTIVYGFVPGPVEHSLLPWVGEFAGEATLHLAIRAAEGLFGEARTRTDVSYHADPHRARALGAQSAVEAAQQRFDVGRVDGDEGRGLLDRTGRRPVGGGAARGAARGWGGWRSGSASRRPSRRAR